MRRMPLWFAVPYLCLLAAACAEDGSDQSHKDSATAGASSEDAGEVDAGGETEQDAGVVSGPDAEVAREPVDQTPPTGANGLVFDAEGMIWLADLIGKQVLRFDPTNGEILARFNQHASGPDDVAIDARGRIFWTDWSSGVVGRIDPKTGDNQIIAQLPMGANSIAFTDDGRFFVGMVLLARGLYELDPEAVREPRLVTDAINVNAFDFGPDGLLWGPTPDGIVRLDLETGDVVETVAPGAYAAVRYSERDHAFFALTNEMGVPRLDKIDPDDHDVSEISKPPFGSVDNFAIGPTGEFFVTAFSQPSFAVFDPDGSLVAVRQIGSAAGL